MLLKYFYDQALAHASYMVGCQKTGEAVIVDPGRDIDQYLQAADKENMRIVGAAETHIHADYVSGARELADRVGAKLFVSDEGPANWKYEYAKDYDSLLLKEGDSFGVGKIKFEVMFTPGHTPESISFVLTDMGGGADQPMGIFTGDFVFVGSIGRPDLLEEAAGVIGSAEEGAKDLYQSVERFKNLPDYLQIWPAHGAGSACGKGLGAIPSSTAGYEKMFNPAMQFDEESTFVDYILADQPEAPKYFAVMKRVNKEGPAILGAVAKPPILNLSKLTDIISQNMVIDTSDSSVFSRGHVPGTINIATRFLAQWAGWIVDYDKPLYLIVSKNELEEAVRVLNKIGIDQISGIFDADQVAAAGLNSQTYDSATPQEMAEKISSGQVSLVDVRSETEWKEGHIPEAQHLFLGRLIETADQVDSGLPVVVQCRTGGRSAIGASILQAAGIKNVINLSGGITEWNAAGLPITTEAAKEATVNR